MLHHLEFPEFIDFDYSMNELPLESSLGPPMIDLVTSGLLIIFGCRSLVLLRISRNPRALIQEKRKVENGYEYDIFRFLYGGR